MVSVSAAGLVTALGAGTARVTASFGGIIGHTDIVVTGARQISTITLTPSSATLAEGDTLRITARAVDADGAVVEGVPFTWISGDPAVATVNDRGLVKALMAGSTSVSAASGGIAVQFALVVVERYDDPQKDALLALYLSTNGDDWKNNTNWLSTEPINSWYGVNADSSGRVLALNMYDNNLSGPIPPDLGRLINLRGLDFFNNNISGPLPPEIGNLTELLVMEFGYNQISGRLPPEIGSLSHLKVLGFTANDLSGPVPSWLNQLGELEEVAFHGNRLEGSIPPELGKLVDLRTLELSGNRLTGTVPKELGNLGSLRRLTLFHNDLTGPLPLELTNLKLTDLYVEGTGLCAPIYPVFQRWLKSVELVIGLPKCNQPELEALIVLYQASGGDNWTNKTGWLTNDQPGDWHGVTTDNAGRILRISLVDNNLSGNLLPELGNLESLVELNLASNELRGAIPAALGELSRLEHLNLGSNNLVGPVPPEIGNLHRIKLVDLSRNRLEGILPSTLTGLGQLETLRLQETGLCASLEAEFQVWLHGVADRYVDDCENLDREALAALYHATEGPNWTNNNGWLTDSSTGEWYGVRVDGAGLVTGLKLASNSLKGRLPSELGNLVNLRRLDLSSNALEGPLPRSLTRLIHLENLLLADTQLCAPLEDEFQAWLAGVNETDVTNCGNPDPEVLAALYYATNGPNWTNSNGWLTNQPLAAWQGVTADSKGRVIELDLSENGLRGQIPAAIAGLSRLRTLVLRGNALDGSIPTELGYLENLVDLDMSWNNLESVIPVELEMLKKLKVLNLRRNRLTGEIPEFLANLENLVSLDLSVNSLTGAIPVTLGRLTRLRKLDLSNNGGLTGVIPPELGKTRSLVELRLSLNGLEGVIPPELGELEHLVVLDLSINGLNGEIPESLGNLTSLSELRLSHNGFSGEIPAALGRLENLQYLELQYNQLNGPIPAELGNLEQLRGLTANNNRLSGRLPPDLGRLRSLRTLILRKNRLSGAIPIEFGDISRLELLDLADNDLSGPVPSSLSRLRFLNTLHLTGTNLCILPDPGFEAWLEDISDSSLPAGCEDPDRSALVALFEATGGSDWINRSGWLTSNALDEWFGVKLDMNGRVTELTLKGNDLNGGIPPELSVLTALESLDLGGNALTGSIPAELGDLFQLRALELGGNKLTDRIPAELGNLTELVRLDLSKNEFVGLIPAELTRLTHLEVLWLHDTQLCVPPSGEMEEWLRGIQDHRAARCGFTNRDALAAFYWATDGPNWIDNKAWLSDRPLSQWEGLDTEGGDRVSSLLFGYNKFTGKLPPEIGHLTELKRFYIEFNGDGLTGPIPPEISKLNKLERLGLPGNRFSGSIPPGLGSLPNLKILRLALNRLTGTIPPELGNLSNLKELDLDNNLLTGEIPPTLGNLTHLESLSLGENQLSGTIPSELGRLTRLKQLWLTNIELSGEIPPELGNLTNLEEFVLHTNKIEGRIPPELGRLANVRQLEIGNNPDLTGPIPPELGNLSKLERISLYNNNLTGTVPEALGGMINLKDLILAANPGLSGPLPESLTGLDLRVLQTFDTGLCAPATTAFDNWLRGIKKQRIVRCEPDVEYQAYLTQATQSLKHKVPLVAGESALLRVFVTHGDAGVATIPPVRAIFFLDGAKVHEIEIPTTDSVIPAGIEEGELSSSSNVEVPAFVIQPGLEMVIEVDPESTLDASLNVGGRIPETGRLPVDVMDVPDLELTIVPLLWFENPDRTVLTDTEGLTADDALFRLTRDILPVREFSLAVRDYVWTGLEPTAENSFEILTEVQALQVADGTGGFYMGVLTNYSGIAFLDGTVSVSFLRDDVIAHELAHNFSLLHAPCGRPSFVDGLFPYKDGSTGSWGYDQQSGLMVPPDTAELMSYCGPPNWISDYHFSQAIRFRQTEAERVIARPAVTRSLLIWGGVNGQGDLFLEPAFVIDAGPDDRPMTGPYRITGEDADRNELFSMDFDMRQVADAEGAAFAFALPIQLSWRNRLDRITLAGPEGEVAIDAAGDTAMALLRDSVTGQVRGFLRNLPVSSSGMVSARRSFPEPGLEMIISQGVPDPADW